ncbi:protein kinase domain-containing protein [Sorangium sp. So ce1389]|uniref:serine/threonine-protein kinase n=1 Tax=Sorangium sp. So ce1389 TaxID=3133336 RepID=UPI003F61D803
MATAQERERRTLDRYTLHGVIASGGMASVHFGRLVGAHGFARTVAIKRLHPQFARDPEFSSMLLDEARLAVRIRHPNVVTTLDSVQADGELFVVMEYIAGESLSSLLRETGRRGVRVPQPVVASILAGALAGLHAAHEATAEDGAPLQIVHRDVSPQNILVGDDGIARVLDFGIARAAVRSQVSRVGQLKGKLSYMAPEQLRGAPVDRRADIYAAAVVLWEVLTGRRLFTGECDAEIFGRILEGVIQPPSVFGDVPPALDAVVLRGLEKDPDRRYATALEMAAALEEALPPASPRAVGAWVEATAGSLLEARAKSLAEIETSQRSAVPTPPPSSPAVVEAPPSLRELDTRPSRPPGSLARAPRPSVTVATMTRTVEDMARPASALATPISATAPSRRASAQLVRATTLAFGVSALVLALVIGKSCSVPPELDAPSADPASADAPSAPAVPAASAAAPEASEAAPGTSEAAPGAPGASEAALEAPATSASAAAPPASASAAAEPGSVAQTTAAERAPGVRAAAPERTARPRSRCVPPYYLDGNGIRRIKRECL